MPPGPPTGRGLRPRLWPSATMLRSDFMAGSAPGIKDTFALTTYIIVVSPLWPFCGKFPNKHFQTKFPNKYSAISGILSAKFVFQRKTNRKQIFLEQKPHRYWIKVRLKNLTLSLIFRNPPALQSFDIFLKKMPSLQNVIK